MNNFINIVKGEMHESFNNPNHQKIQENDQTIKLPIPCPSVD